VGLHRVRERPEHDALLLELGLVGGGDGDAVEDRVDGYARQSLLLDQRNPELLVRAQQLRVHLVEALQLRLLLGRRVVVHRLVVDLRVVDLRPGRLGPFGEQLEEASIGLEPPLEQPLGLVLLRGDQPHGLLGEALRDGLLLDVRDEAVLVLTAGQLLELSCLRHLGSYSTARVVSAAG
jgi:hypothetical protein